MNDSLHTLALRKQLLSARSELYRLQMANEIHEMRDRLDWLPLARSIVTTLSIPAALARITTGRAGGRLARVIALGARVVLIANLVRLALKRKTTVHASVLDLEKTMLVDGLPAHAMTRRA